MRQKTVLIAFVVAAVLLLVLMIVGVVWFAHKQRVPKTSTVVPNSGTDVHEPVNTPNSVNIGAGPGKYYHHGSVLLPNPNISPGEVRNH